MAFNSAIPYLTAEGDETHYDTEMKNLYHYEETISNDKKVFRCFTQTCTASVSHANGVWIKGQQPHHESDTCTMSADTFINLRAVQQIKLNSEDMSICGDVYEMMIESLKDSTLVPQDYIDNGSVELLPVKEALKSSSSTDTAAVFGFGHLPVFTEEEKALIAAVRAKIGPRLSSAVDDMDCLRFLRARKEDVTLASTMVQNW